MDKVRIAKIYEQPIHSAMMFSLRSFPILIECTTLFPSKPKPMLIRRCSRTINININRTNSIITFTPNSDPLPKLLMRGSATDAIFSEEERADHENKKSVAGHAGDLPAREPLPAILQPELMPRHIAVIADGNARWARERGLPASSGHEEGVRVMRELIKLCSKWGIPVFSVFIFSYDNWNRPKVETDFLMNLFETRLRTDLEKIAREKIRISAIGDKSKLPKSVQKLISETENDTKDNSGLHVIVAISYSGKYDILQASKSIACNVKDGLIQIEDINEALVERKLETNCTEFPCPDLLIRTSSELRVSNFLLWQLAYSELFFARVLWPDFGKEEFVEALSSFQKRSRRYGHH